MTRQSFWEGGRFGSKSLEEFLPGMAAMLKCALNDTEKIKLVLLLETREVEVEMEARREDIWEMAINFSPRITSHRFLYKSDSRTRRLLP